MRLFLIIVLSLSFLIDVAYATKYCPNPDCSLYKKLIYPDDANYCDDCGTKLKKVPPTPPPEGPQTKVVGHGIKLVRIPGGTFQMGSNDGNADEKPVHTVTVDSFWMGETEVTIGQYVAFLNEVKPSSSQLEPWIYLDEYAHIKKSGNNYYADSGWEKHPVVSVSWYGARDFCAQYGLRLPTEAEWEYAAGGPKHYKYPWGNEFSSQKCCFSDNKGNGSIGTMEVRHFSRNGYWLYDMAGNAWEWCNDWYDNYSSYAQNNPQGSTSGDYKIIRGGSWLFDAAYLRCASRGRNGPSSRDYSRRGFRVAGD